MTTDKTDGLIIETLCSNDWVSLKIARQPSRGVNGYVYSHEERCQGRIVAVLPFRAVGNGVDFLVRREITPCWGMILRASAITGGWEGANIVDDAVRELEEEAGYTVQRDQMVNVGWSFGTKSTDTIYDLFAVDLTNVPQGEAKGDGSLLEAEGSVEWYSTQRMLSTVCDPIVYAIYGRLLVDNRFINSYFRPQDKF